MKITHLTLDNFQSYDHEEIDFEDGVSLFHGDNGAGKSTILRAVFAGLFQTDMSRHSATGFSSIGELVRQGESEGGVTLTFELGPNEYELSWRIEVDDPGETSPTGKTTECLLTSPSLSDPVDGITNVRQAIQTELIGMDARSFASSVYVQQDEVMRLITADDSERQEIFDGLLGLSKLDEYIERTVELRRAAKSAREDAKTRREELESQLEEEFPDRAELLAKQTDLAAELDDAKQARNQLQEQVSSLEDEKDAIETRIENYTELEAEQERLNDEITSLTEKMEAVEAEIETLNDEIDHAKKQMWATRKELSAKESDFDDIDISSEDAARDALETARDSVLSASKEETKAEQRLKTAQETRDAKQQAVSDKQAELDALNEELAQKQDERDTLAEKLTAAEEAVEAKEAERDALVREHLPNDHVPAEITQETREVVEAHIDRLDAEREDANQTIARLDAEIKGLNDSTERLSEKIRAVREEREDAVAQLPEDVEVETRTPLEDAHELSTTFSVIDQPPIDTASLNELRTTWVPDAQSHLVTEYRTALNNLSDVRADIKWVATRLDDYDALIHDTGCPLCHSDVVAPSKYEDKRDEFEAEQATHESTESELSDHIATLEAEQERLFEFQNLLSEAIVLQNITELDEELAELQDEQKRVRAEKEEKTAEREAAREVEQNAEVTISRLRSTVLPAFTAVEEAKQTYTEYTEEREALTETITGLEATIAEEEQALADRTDAVASAEDEIEAAREALDAATEAVEDAEAQKTALEAVVDLYADLSAHEQAIENKEREKTNKRSVLDTRREQRGEKQTRLDEVTAELSQADVDDLRADLAAKKTEITEARERLSTARDRVDDVNGELVRVEGKLDSYDTLSSRIDSLDSEMSWAQGIVDEMNALIETYETVKMKLRKENLAYINAYTNEVFRDLYQSSAYERVILNDDYTISLLKSNGMTISPKLSSGGESAIVNIALRAGIYRTIAERNQGSMSTLPPLILDEPTTFLDSTHVRELETVINSIQQWNVAQVFIVSHDDSLIDAADYEYEVTKSASSDVSSCSLKQANKSV